MSKIMRASYQSIFTRIKTYSFLVLLLLGDIVFYACDSKKIGTITEDEISSKEMANSPVPIEVNLDNNKLREREKRHFCLSGYSINGERIITPIQLESGSNKSVSQAVLMMPDSISDLSKYQVVDNDTSFKQVMRANKDPDGTDNIKAWKKRVPEFTKKVKKRGVEIVNAIDQLLDKVDGILLTTIDGNKHLEQALPVLRAGKPLFIDKPLAASLSDAYEIVEAARKYNVPMFSSSSLRYIEGAEEIAQGKVGKIKGVNAYSLAHIEEHHPDVFWYGVHGVKILFTLMGTGCTSVQRTYTEGTDLVVGAWNDNRIGCYRGIREGKGDYGGMVFGEKDIEALGNYKGYGPLMENITQFFSTGIPLVPAKETLEIFAFMQAAEISKQKRGVAVNLEAVIENTQ